MIRATPRPGDIGLTNITGLVGKGIEVGQWLNGDGFAPWAHAFLVMPDGKLIEAMPGGAQVVPLTEYDDRDVVYVSPAGLTPAQRWAITACARQYEGVPYSFADYAALATHRLHIPAPGLRTFVASTGHMICSQLVDRAYLDAGIQLFNDKRWEGYVTPMALFNRLSPIAS
ncbi:hypothetical protein ACGF3G_00150 [Streptomyces sp. NPDC048179]|uniref:hypothetical protein n=1 Tax=Streptomyces sp. NPDC048179 TaxID=3365506 RepID=UPI003718C963